MKDPGIQGGSTEGPRIHFVNVKVQSALWARAQLCSAVSDEHKLLQTHNSKRSRGYGLKTSPLDSQKPLKHEHHSTVDTSADETSDSYLVLRQIAPDSFISPGGATSAVDPFAVSAQTRRIRRPNSGLCPVLECREAADPFVRVADVKFDRTIKVFCERAALLWSQEAAQPARHESDEPRRKSGGTVGPGPAPSRCCPISFPHYLSHLIILITCLQWPLPSQ